MDKVSKKLEGETRKSFHAGSLVKVSRTLEKPTEIMHTCGRDQNKILISQQYASFVQARSKATDWEGAQHDSLDVVVLHMKGNRVLDVW